MIFREYDGQRITFIIIVYGFASLKMLDMSDILEQVSA